MSSPEARAFVDSLAIEPLFQPIVDVLAVDAVGYEVLSRSSVPTVEMFERARAEGVTWELEHKCRMIAFARIASLAPEQRRGLFFLNVSPRVFEDERFVQGRFVTELSQHSLSPAQIVVELTESHGIEAPDRFERTLSMYGRQGFRFAVDDFGSGHSSLLTLITCAPRFIKLDMGVVRDVDKHAYRRHLIRSLSAFASSVDARLVAEGVESWAELQTLLRLGVRYVQGFLLGRPSLEVATISNDVKARVRELVRGGSAGLSDPEEALAPLIRAAEIIDPRTHTVADVDRLFRRNEALDHIVLVEAGRAVGMVTREDFTAKVAGPYGFALHQRKPVSTIAKQNPLTVDVSTAVTALARRAMDRNAHVYDPVIVTEADGSVLGSVTMKAVIERSIELRIRTAQSSNPLTGLPGNHSIQKWIARYEQTPTLDVVYADLDRFKEYNDHYGFLLGDEMIRLAARMLTRHMISEQPDAHLGHVGGDDFVAVFPSGISEQALERACSEMDLEKAALFEPEEIERGFIPAVNRRGETEQVPLVTLSLAVVRRASIEGPLHPAMLSQLAAMLKDKAKRKTAAERKSCFVIEQRFHPERLRKPTPLDGILLLRDQNTPVDSHDLDGA